MFFFLSRGGNLWLTQILFDSLVGDLIEERFFFFGTTLTRVCKSAFKSTV